MKNNLDSYPECNDKRNREIKSILYLQQQSYIQR